MDLSDSRDAGRAASEGSPQRRRAPIRSLSQSPTMRKPINLELDNIDCPPGHSEEQLTDVALRRLFKNRAHKWMQNARDQLLDLQQHPRASGVQNRPY